MAAALEQLLPIQRADFVELFEIMQGQPVCIRLFDPPLHEFLPSDRDAMRDLAESLDLPIAEPILAPSEGLAVKRGEQELLNFLNAWVTARDADRWIPSTHDYWFGTLDWLYQIEGE